MDPEFEKKLKGAGEVWKGIKGKAVTALDAMHAQGTPTGPARQKRLAPKKDISKPSTPGAASAPSVASLKKQRPSIIKAPERKGVSGMDAAPMTSRDIPTPSFNARDTIPRSTIFTKARENLQRQGTGGGASFPDTFGSMYIKDPATGQNIPREGYFNEAGTFISGPRVKPWETGTLTNYATANVKNPELQKIIAQGITKQAGVLDPETGRIGSELARRGEQTLANIRGKYAERVANIQGQSDIEQTRIAANAKGESAATTPLKPYTGTLTQEDEFGNKSQFPLNEYTGQVAPGYGNNTELTPEAMKHIDKIRSSPEKMKQFYKNNPGMRETIKKYLGSKIVY